MKTKEAIAWATNYLAEHGPRPTGPAEPVRTTPWSMVARIPTIDGFVYLKQMGAPFDREHLLLRQLAKWDKSGAWPLPRIPAVNEGLGCFLMKDAGRPLREILKESYQTDIVIGLMPVYASIQKASLPRTEELLALGLPDWRLENWPRLYDDLMEHVASLDIEADLLQALKDHKGIVIELCSKLTGYNIPAALEHTDFNDSNVLIKDVIVTLNDWGDATVNHPFFSLASWLASACRTHGFTTTDERYVAIRDSYLNCWLGYGNLEKLREAFAITAKLNSLRFCISYSRVSQCEGFETYTEYKPYLVERLEELVKTSA